MTPGEKQTERTNQHLMNYINSVVKGVGEQGGGGAKAPPGQKLHCSY